RGGRAGRRGRDAAGGAGGHARLPAVLRGAGRGRRGAGRGGAVLPAASGLTARARRSGGEDAELVALGVGQDVPLDVLVAGPDQRGAQAEQLRLVAGDVQVHPVLHRLRLGYRDDPDQRPPAGRVLDRDRPVGRPRALAFTADVTERRAPPVGQGLVIAGV